LSNENVTPIADILGVSTKRNAIKHVRSTGTSEDVVEEVVVLLVGGKLVVVVVAAVAGLVTQLKTIAASTGTKDLIVAILVITSTVAWIPRPSLFCLRAARRPPCLDRTFAGGVPSRPRAAHP